MFEIKACEVRKCGVPTTRDEQFSYEHNADIGHYGQTLNSTAYFSTFSNDKDGATYNHSTSFSDRSVIFAIFTGETSIFFSLMATARGYIF